VIADEAHHLGEELAWGEGFALAFRNAARWLLLSGTPFRSDTTPIPGVRYDADGVAVADVAYTYADAVREGVCRPVTFIPYDGTLSWQSGDDVIEAGFDTVLSTREASRRYRTAISAELSDGLPRILAAAHAKLHEARAAGHRDAGGLVVAADSDHARKIAKLLKDVSGKSPTVVLHAEAGAHKKLAAFTESRDEWIVAVNMVSEGVDIPRLRVGVYASAAKTPLIFRQVVGRFVRTIAGRPADMSWLYLPGDAVLRRHATDVEGELRHVLRRRESDEELFDERPERAESERGEAAEFVALSADVAPTSQMSLFGGGPTVAAATSPILPSFTAAVQDGDDEEPVTASRLSAFERRNILRDKRHRLVGDLGRRDRRPHREINAWLNQAVGVTRVEDATIDQLERSVDLLLDALAGKAAGRR
jgi:superfamily II DNA or RNA helicase